ncbi:late sexual development protein [Amniculicola lignicola CBS 123094]|uniref:Late sexual development protein n=1 Tax=Amniculicola lignicola CBS 123094 TaxID=1392246 RepID=A0A6A5WAC1_9PLEO|nr:late sexual development protein [Amniculicola lignicola CBS 123094]
MDRPMTNGNRTSPAAKRDFSPDGKYFPTPNGLPNPTQDQILQIQKAAFGTLPNGPPPAKVSEEGLTNLRLLALNELFEVAFFTELIHNVTNKVHGYDLGHGHNYVLDSLKAIQSQEELHALNVNGALKKFNAGPIEPCRYSFPVTDFQSAINLAATFTDLVLGTLQDVNFIFAQNGDAGLVRGVSSVLGNEAEQEGFYHVLQSKRPTTLPFLTTSVRDFAFTALQSFFIPGSCPNIGTIKLKTFAPLNVLTTGIKPVTQSLKFSFSLSKSGGSDWESFRIVYINQQNLPVVKKLQNVDVKGDVVTFHADFPFDEFTMNGLTIAAVVKGDGPFPTAAAVADVAIFGPGLIEV